MPRRDTRSGAICALRFTSKRLAFRFVRLEHAIVLPRRCVNFHVPTSTPSRGSGRLSARMLKSISLVNVSNSTRGQTRRGFRFLSQLLSDFTVRFTNVVLIGAAVAAIVRIILIFFLLLRPETGLKMSKVRARKPGWIRGRCDERQTAQRLDSRRQRRELSDAQQPHSRHVIYQSHRSFMLFSFPAKSAEWKVERVEEKLLKHPIRETCWLVFAACNLTRLSRGIKRG
jgi:hypothetical protein